MAVRTERNGRVLTVILERPNVRNAVDAETAQALYDAFVAFEDDAAADVAVFWGSHGSFCAGADLKALSQRTADGDRLQGLHWSGTAVSPGPPGPMGPTRLDLSKPVIAAVAGAAVAGGTELALWCDIRVMEEDAFFGIYCRRWGVPLIDGGTVRLPRLVGEGRALDIIMTGRKVSAPEALAIGMCERVVPKGQARQAAEALAEELTRFPQACLRADRRSAREQWGMPIGEALRREWEQSWRVVRDEGIAGAGRFAAGKGRHGDFGDI